MKFHRRLAILTGALGLTLFAVAVTPSVEAKPPVCRGNKCPPPTTTVASTTTTVASTTTTRPATTTTASSSTSSTTTTTAPPTGAAFTETFSGSLSRFTAAHWRNDETGELNPALNGSAVLIENGTLRVESGEQNYGDSAVRINQPFDFAGRTGTFSTDVTLIAQDGWTRLTLSEDPYAVTSYGDDNAAGQGANRGIDLQIQNFAGCPVVTLRTYANRVETDYPAGYVGCDAVGSATRLDRLVVTVSNSTVVVKVGSVTIGNFTGLNLGFSRGYWYLDAHNHATIKYANQPTWITHWDNVTFDGPTIAALNVSAATIEGRTLAGVPSGPGSPRLIFNAQHGQQDASPTLRYALNGRTSHLVPLVRLAGLTGVYMLSLPVDPAELVVGANTVAFTWTGTTGLPARVADVQLAWTTSGNPPPITTTTTTTPTTPTTTVPPPTGGYTADFANPAQFDNEFVYDVGNWIDGTHTRRTSAIVNGCCGSATSPHDTHGDHDLACGNPATTERILDNSNDDMRKYFWACLPGNDPAKGHLMTAFDTTGYTVVSFSPNRIFSNLTRVCWEINATEEGGGKWTNMIIVPEALYQQFKPRMDYVRFDFNDQNAPGDFNIQMADHPGKYFLGVTDFRGTQFVYNGDQLISHPGGDIANTTTDKAARYQHCLTKTSSTMSRLTVARPNGTVSTFDVTTDTAWPTGQVRVIFQDEMYDPPKREGYNARNVTWHWDLLQIS